MKHKIYKTHIHKQSRPDKVDTKRHFLCFSALFELLMSIFVHQEMLKKKIEGNEGKCRNIEYINEALVYRTIITKNESNT